MFTDNYLTINKSKLVVLPLALMNPNEKKRFEPDGNLTGKTITGIQWHTVSEIGSAANIGGVNYTVVGPAANPDFTLTLFNHLGEVVLNGCPLITFVVNQTGRKEVRRTDFKIILDQSFVLNLLPGTTFSSSAALFISFYYQ